MSAFQGEHYSLEPQVGPLPVVSGKAAAEAAVEPESMKPRGGDTNMVFWRKVFKLLRKVAKLLFLLICPLLVLVVRVLRPVILIRFGRLYSDRIGHFALEPELFYLCRRDAGMVPQRTLDIFYYDTVISNYQLKKMWDRTLLVARTWLGSSLVYLVDRWNRRLWGYEVHVIKFPKAKDFHDFHGLLDRFPPHLSFTLDEEREGSSALRELGIPEQTPFICFINRDSAYLAATVTWRTEHWQRNNDYRDFSIYDCLPAVEELVRRGYFAIRMGAVVKEALDTTNPYIFDYATKARNDFLDVYLFAKCRFMIATASGPASLGWIFRRPIALINVIPLHGAPIPARAAGDLFIPQKCWLIKEKRLMTFKEQTVSGAAKFYAGEQFLEHDIEVISNTPEEITDLVIEMDERLKGTWQPTEEDEILQARFESINELAGVRMPRIGAKFLRQNRQLLD
jgi:putative glycosyltransferase (TIGR04372 family)